jgi:hypothetical protein
LYYLLATGLEKQTMMMPPSTRTFAARLRSRPQYVVLAVCAISLSFTFLVTWNGEEPTTSSLQEKPRRLNFVSVAADQYEGLVQPSALDKSISDRLPTQGNEGESLCDDILLYMPQSVAHKGHGAQLNSYLLAAVIATFTNKAMIVLDPAWGDDNAYKGKSQFGCLPEWLKEVMRPPTGIPHGLGRLLDYPAWLSSGCAVPCQYSYKDWDRIRTKRTSEGPYYPSLYTPQEVSCMQDVRKTKVLVVGGQEVHDYFDGHFKEKMVERPSSDSYGWAMRLGAEPAEATKFAELEGERAIFDYIGALLAHSGVLKFQPWIARDVEDYIKRSGLPLTAAYDVIHVRRGEKPEGAEDSVAWYWNEASNRNLDEEAKDFIPFAHYLKQFDDLECNFAPHKDNVTHSITSMSLGRGEQVQDPKLVYIATDDRKQVLSEIDQLPKDDEGNTVVNECHKFKFITSPHHNDIFNLHAEKAMSNCRGRYSRNIASVGDMMIAAKSDRFVGEFNSEWGRLVRIFRMQLTDVEGVYDHVSPTVVQRDMKVAWGNEEPLPPGM